MRQIFAACCALWLCVAWGTAAEPVAKPRLKLAADKFPTGHETPEGAACDYARAFVKQDPALFTEVCIKPFGGGEDRQGYEGFLGDVADSMKLGAAAKSPAPYAPKSIVKVFAARHLSAKGPASYGYASFGFEDVMFVDVEEGLADGERSPTRNLVIKTGGKWYVDPAPQFAPLLSVGLEDETPSTRDFAEVYEVEP